MISEGKFSVPFNPSGKAGLQLPWFPEENQGKNRTGRYWAHCVWLTSFIVWLYLQYHPLAGVWMSEYRPSSVASNSQ